PTRSARPAEEPMRCSGEHTVVDGDIKAVFAIRMFSRPSRRPRRLEPIARDVALGATCPAPGFLMASTSLLTYLLPPAFSFHRPACVQESNECATAPPSSATGSGAGEAGRQPFMDARVRSTPRRGDADPGRAGRRRRTLAGKRLFPSGEFVRRWGRL